MAADITGTYLNLNNGYPRGYETDTDSMSPFTLWSPKSSSLYSSTSQHNTTVLSTLPLHNTTVPSSLSLSLPS